MAAYHKVEVSLNTNAVEVGIPSPQTVNVVVPLVGPQGPAGATGATGAVGPQGPQGPAGTGLETLTTQGDTLYRGASTGERLPIGTAGQVLKVVNGLPAWANESGAVSSVAGRTGAVTLSSVDISSEQVLEVSEAGDANCNGVFVYGGDFNGRPTYYKDKDTFVYWDNVWNISHNAGDKYIGTNTSRPWQAVWSLGSATGNLPVVEQLNGQEYEKAVGQRTNPTLRGDAAGKNVGTGANDVAAGNHTHSSATTTVAGFLSAADKSKLDGIAAGAEVNVNADWNASSGDAQILNKPTIPSASSATPSALGTAAAGSSTDFARADHVHAMPNASDLLSTGAGEGDLPVAQGDGTIDWQNGTTWAGLNITAADVGAAAATHASTHAASGSDPVSPSSIGAQSIFVTENLGTITADANLTAARAKIYTVTVNTFDTPTPSVRLPSTDIVAGDVVQIRFTSNTGRTMPVKNGDGSFLGNNLSNGQQATFIAASTASTSWSESPNNRFAVGSSSGTPIITGSGGYIGGGSFGTSAGQFAEGNHTHELNALGATGATNGHVLTANGSGGASFAALPASGISAVGASAADILSVSGSDLVADDLGADKLYGWDDSAGKAIGFTIGSGLTVTDDTLSASGGIGGSTGSTDNAILRADGTGGATVQSSAFIIADNATASPNNTVNHASIQATGDTTNVSVSIVPKGSGAFMLRVPDAASTGGNTRGANAVDLQTSRSAATQVASGQESVVCGGVNNTASATQSVVCGGSGNTASGFQSAVFGGRSNTANNDRCFAFGDGNTASSTNAVAFGSGNTASAVQALAIGTSSRADRNSFLAHAAGAFSSAGDAQRVRAVLRNKTTTNSAVELFLDGSSARLTAPSGKVIAMIVNITGVKSDGSAVAHYVRQYAIKNVGGTTSEVYAPVTIGTDNAASTSIALSANDTNDALKIECTGIASETWRWVASVDAVEVAYGT